VRARELVAEGVGVVIDGHGRVDDGIVSGIRSADHP